MGYFVTLPIPFDIVDVAIAEYLKYFVRGFVEFSRDQITGASAVYKLNQWQLGVVGEFRIRKLLNNHSELFVNDPELPSFPYRQYTQEEQKLISNGASKEDRIELTLSV